MGVYKIWPCIRNNGLTSLFREVRVFKGSDSRRYAERIWGEFLILVRRNRRKIAGEFPQRILMANFDGEFCGLVFPGFARPPKTFTSNLCPPKI